MSSPPPIAILGHVAHDIIRHGVHEEPQHALGGAAAFAARAAGALGYPVELVTAAPQNFDLLEPLRQMPGLRLHLKSCNTPTTFELDYTGPRRQIHLRARAPTLLPDDIPQSVRRAPLVYVGPVIGECGHAVIDALESDCVVVGAQGWLRRADGEGLLIPEALEEATDPPAVRAVVFSELDHPDAETICARMARRSTVVVLTRGARGITLYTDGGQTDLPTTPVDDIDPTGAGDVFGLVLGIELERGAAITDAARVAMRAAASVVQGPGLGRLPEIRDTLITV